MPYIQSKKFPILISVVICAIARCQLGELQDPGALYDALMSLLLKLANYGVIHSDFNEFNIMIDDNEKPILIDFPQMVSTSHSEAEKYIVVRPSFF